MLKPKSDLESYLSNKFNKLIYDKKSTFKYYEACYDSYKLKESIVADYVTERKSLDNASEFELFILMDCLKNIGIETRDLSYYYSQTEISNYMNTIIQEDRLEFPIRIPMVQITSSQWIGSIDVNLLMKFRSEGLINYNANAQRVMQRIVRKEKEYFKIALNKNAVSQIKDSFETGNYIPNTLTLNIPLDGDCEFYYDDKTKELVIESIEHFDITDGYHRYIALSQIKDSNPDFNYKMELRIVNFDESKAKVFIFQEDQKTKMKKVDSNSFNMNSPENIIVERFNESYKNPLKGMVNNTNGIIKASVLADLIKKLFIGNKTSNKEILLITNELINFFNLLAEYDIKYVSNKYDNYELITLICIMKYMESNEFDINKTDDIVNIVRNKIDERKVTPSKINLRLLNEIIGIIKKEA